MFGYLVSVNDYGALQQDVMLSAVNNRPCVNITITNDTVPEQEEFFEVALINVRRISATVPTYHLAIAVTNVTIYDDDCEYTCMQELLCPRKRSVHKNSTQTHENEHYRFQLNFVNNHTATKVSIQFYCKCTYTH